MKSHLRIRQSDDCSAAFIKLKNLLIIYQIPMNCGIKYSTIEIVLRKSIITNVMLDYSYYICNTTFFMLLHSKLNTFF